MFAVVEAGGTRSRGYPDGAGYTSAKMGTGQYEVIFGTTNIRACAYLGVIGTHLHFGEAPTYPPGFILVVGRSTTTAGVWVETYNSSGALADRGFHLAVTCPP
jgi:hypothetical protein